MIAQLITADGIRFVDIPQPLPHDWKLPVRTRPKFTVINFDKPVPQAYRLFRRVGDFTYEEVT